MIPAPHQIVIHQQCLLKRSLYKIRQQLSRNLVLQGNISPITLNKQTLIVFRCSSGLKMKIAFPRNQTPQPSNSRQHEVNNGQDVKRRLPTKKLIPHKPLRDDKSDSDSASSYTYTDCDSDETNASSTRAVQNKRKSSSIHSGGGGGSNKNVSKVWIVNI